MFQPDNSDDDDNDKDDDDDNYNYDDSDHDDDDDDDDDNEEEDNDDMDDDKNKDGNGGGVVTNTRNSASNIIKTSNFEELQVEFAKLTNRIKIALMKNKTDVGTLIEQLSAISAVKYKKVPLFDENVFEKVKTVEDLWRILRSYWSICDYDLLIYILKLVECKEANDVYEEFWSRIDPCILQDIRFILSCMEYEGEGLKLLRIKLNTETLTVEVQKKAKKAVSQMYNLTKYALTFKGIKQGCIELIYGISKALMSYLLQFKVTGHDLHSLSICNILYLQVFDKKLVVPSEITDKVSYDLYVPISYIKLQLQGINLQILNNKKNWRIYSYLCE